MPVKYLLNLEGYDIKYEVLQKVEASIVSKAMNNKEVIKRIMLQLITLQCFETVETDPILNGNFSTENDMAIKLLGLIQNQEPKTVFRCLETLCNLEDLPKCSEKIRNIFLEVYPGCIITVQAQLKEPESFQRGNMEGIQNYLKSHKVTYIRSDASIDRCTKQLDTLQTYRYENLSDVTGGIVTMRRSSNETQEDEKGFTRRRNSGEQKDICIEMEEPEQKVDETSTMLLPDEIKEHSNFTLPSNRSFISKIMCILAIFGVVFIIISLNLGDSQNDNKFSNHSLSANNFNSSKSILVNGTNDSSIVANFSNKIAKESFGNTEKIFESSVLNYNVSKENGWYNYNFH